ncbi:carboxyltransferase domain-containing protein [Mammaliicoccus sp. Dog046]|uniref:carboxyltransferase domain-containing protein n=1 Tax=Mammaliicoccus sp. Dog046 TaxID=3034233 RepID=UPI002B257274|nr:carboxyltransferase domain-containing protein [Mammaliicoccus sp. Dog046]WQK85041.1 carboxyltransferase domain-containing protein [Mammaliicoccus sp. Dog046]
MRIYPKGDSALTVISDREASRQLTHEINEFRLEILKQDMPFIDEVIPSETSLMVVYHPYSMMMNHNIDKPFQYMTEFVERIIYKKKQYLKDREIVKTSNVVEVVIGGKYGPDFNALTDLSIEEQKQVLESRTYFVSMIGHTPGCPYLSGLSHRLHATNSDYKQFIPKGSVCIERDKLFITTTNTSGNWPVIGWTNDEIFDVESSDCKLKFGDDVVLNIVENFSDEDGGYEPCQS